MKDVSPSNEMVFAECSDLQSLITTVFVGNYEDEHDNVKLILMLLQIACEQAQHATPHFGPAFEMCFPRYCIRQNGPLHLG